MLSSDTIGAGRQGFTALSLLAKIRRGPTATPLANLLLYFLLSGYFSENAMRATSLLRTSANTLSLNEPTRKVIVRGVSFHLSPAQLEADSPNIWTENARQSGFWYPLHVDRDPRLFEVILNHLSGYDIFPLSERGFQTDRLNATRNLERDAEFYQLDGLRARVKEELGRLSASAVRGESREEDARFRRIEVFKGGAREA